MQDETDRFSKIYRLEFGARVNIIGRTRIKVCGTTNQDDAGKAVELGVDALGFIFAPKSPRYIIPEAALQIIGGLPPLLFKVGVFVDKQLEEIVGLVHCLGLNGVQLHGKETPEFCRKLGTLLPTCALVKAFRVGETSIAGDFSIYEDVVHCFLLDTYVKDMDGGTGLAFDWSVIRSLKLKKPFILAGGLHPGNVAEALTVARPYAVDINSGVEYSAGKKDHSLLQCCVTNVTAFDRAQAP